MPATPPLPVRTWSFAASEFNPTRRAFAARMRRAPLLAASLVALGALIGCGSQAAPTPPDKPVASSSAAPAISASAVAPAPKGPLTQREGQALVRSPNEAALYLADED